MDVRRTVKVLLFLTAMVGGACGTAQAQVRVLSVSPSGQVQDGDRVTAVSVTFDRAMAPVERKSPEGFACPFVIMPPVQGRCRWDGSSTLTFLPDNPLPYATRYEIAVPASLRSQVTGETMEKDYRWSFETTRPDLVNSYPFAKYDLTQPEDRIFLLFNQPMDPRKVKPLYPGTGKSFIRLVEHTPGGGRNDIDFTVRQAVEKDGAGQDVFYALHNPDNRPRILVIVPSRPLRKGLSYSLELAEGLQGREGELGMKPQRTLQFQTYKPFRFIRPADWDATEPSTGIEFRFTTPVQVKELAAAMRIEPAVQLPDYLLTDESFADRNQDGTFSVRFPLEWKPGLTYKVTIRSRLADRFGQRLEKEIAAVVRTTDYAPKMFMPEGVGIVEAYMQPPRHPLNVVNMPRLHLQMASIDANGLIPLLNGTWTSGDASVTPPGGFQVDRMLELPAKKNERTLVPLELSEALGGRKGAIVFLQLEDVLGLRKGLPRFRQALLQVTSLGLTGKFSPDGALIYVSSLKDCKPVAGCSLELRSAENKVLWTGTTDRNGFAKTPDWETLKVVPPSRWNKPLLYVIARKDGDIAYIHSDWGTGIYPYNFNIPYEWYPTYPDYAGHLFTERGIYRPGETVYLKGIVREKRFGAWQLPRLSDYHLIVKDSRSAEVVRATVTLSDFGSFDYSYAIKPESPTGYYSVYLLEKSINIDRKAGQGDGEYENDPFSENGDRKVRLSASFRVEEYKPAAFEVTVGHDKSEYVLLDTAAVSVNGRYLFGAPMSEAAVSFTARLEQADFSPEGFDGYAFGTWDWEEDNPARYGISLFSERKKLDKDGNYTARFPLNSHGAQGPFRLISEGVATAPDRQQLSGRKTAMVHAGEYYVGIKASSTFIEKGKKFKAGLVTIAPDGKACPGREVRCELIRREWQSVRRAGTGGRWEWETKIMDVTVSSFTFTSDGKPYEWQCSPAVAGYYSFRASSVDPRGNRVSSAQYFYVTGTDYCAWARGDDDRIDLVADKAKYKPGETAKILVKSPYESANAVVTLEREGIISQWSAKVNGSADTISIPITKDHLPNVYVCVMLYQGRLGQVKFSKDGDDLGKPAFKIGYTNLPVDPGDKHLAVSVTPEKKEYRPGDTVNVKLKVADAAGKGTRAEVDVAVSDLGILNLIAYGTPNPFPYFYGPRPLSVETAESRLHLMGQRNYGEKGENRGGGGGLGAEIDIRSKFVPTAYWNPKVITGDNGKAEFSFVLPDNLTAFRIMATAHTKDSSFGCGDSRITVSKPLLLKPSLPRFAHLGDTFSAGVLCHNNSQEDGEVTVKAAVKGARLTGGDTQKIAVAKGQAKEVRFDFSAETTGSAAFVFTAEMGKETDGLRWTVPVSAPRPTEAAATFGSTTGIAHEAIKIPSDIYEDPSCFTLSLAPTAMVGLQGGLEYLFAYPYGCCEQKTSKVLPLILAADFIDLFNLAPLKEHGAKEIINSWLAELPQYQSSSGGFCFWKGSDLPSPYLTAYVLWALGEAAKKEYAVDADLRDRAATYLSGYLHGEKTGWSWPYNVSEELSTRAFAVYALSLNGRREQSYINDLFARRDQLPLMAKVHLMKAINAEGMDRGMIEPLVQDLYNAAKFAPTEVHFEEPRGDRMWWIWDSNLRTTAAILQGLIEVKGQFPNAEKIARWLTGARKADRWNSTQENLYAFYAFSAYAGAYEKQDPDFTARVTLEGKELLTALFKGRTTEAKTTRYPVAPYKKDVQLPMVFDKSGQGRLYYELRLLYSPKGELKSMDEGFRVEKKIEPFKGKIDGDTCELSGRYKVTLKVTTDQERHFVVVDDPLPAGFEIVNLSLDTESSTEAREFAAAQRVDDAGRWWGGFDHSENYDNRVLLFASCMTKGEHTYSYLVQATTPGDFLLPPTKAEEMYTPEVFGRTGQKRIKIK